MNRQQRRAQERANKKGGNKNLSYQQGAAIATEAWNRGYDRATAKQEEIHAEDQPKVFMYTFALVLKTLREQWGWGYTRLARLTEQVLTEFNENDMNLEEIQQWCWEYGGFKLQIDDETN